MHKHLTSTGGGAGAMRTSGRTRGTSGRCTCRVWRAAAGRQRPRRRGWRRARDSLGGNRGGNRSCSLYFIQPAGHPGAVDVALGVAYGGGGGVGRALGSRGRVGLCLLVLGLAQLCSSGLPHLLSYFRPARRRANTRACSSAQRASVVGPPAAFNCIEP